MIDDTRPLLLEAFAAIERLQALAPIKTPDNISFAGWDIPLGETEPYTSREGLLEQIRAFHEDAGILWYFAPDDRGIKFVRKVIFRSHVEDML